MADALLAYPRDLAAPCLAEGTTFKVTVHSQGGRKMNDDERLTPSNAASRYFHGGVKCACVSRSALSSSLISVVSSSRATFFGVLLRRAAVILWVNMI